MIDVIFGSFILFPYVFQDSQRLVAEASGNRQVKVCKIRSIGHSKISMRISVMRVSLAVCMRDRLTQFRHSAEFDGRFTRTNWISGGNCT